MYPSIFSNNLSQHISIIPNLFKTLSLSLSLSLARARALSFFLCLKFLHSNIGLYVFILTIVIHRIYTKLEFLQYSIVYCIILK